MLSGSCASASGKYEDSGMAEEIHIIDVTFGGTTSATTEPRYQYDYGQALRFSDLSLPPAYEVHFSNSRTYENAALRIGNETGVAVPDEYLGTGKAVYAWIFLHDEVTDGRTMYVVTIPVIKRPAAEDPAPSAEEASAITQAIAALNAAVARTGADAGQTAEDALTSAQNAESSLRSAAAAAQSASSAASSEENALSYAQRAEAAERNASESAENAAISANAAERNADRAEMAATNAGYFAIEMDARDHLIYTRTDAVDVDFDLTESGHLIMEVI